MSNALSDYVASTRYTRYSETLGRLETWEEAAERVRDMHLQFYADKLALPLWEGRTLGDWIGEAFDAVKRKEVLPSMRSLQFGGPAILANNARIYNCSFSPADRPAFFKEFFWLLLCGTGVGFSVQKHHVEKLYPIAEYWDVQTTFVVPDTIEGWALAIDEQVKNALQGCDTVFDFSLIRPKGALLKTSGGRAPGALPLICALALTRDILLGARGRKLRPIEVYDICMHVAKAVLSGGIRRSATICLFSPDDVEMKNAKAEDMWWEKNPQRTASNNSAMLCRATCSKAEFDSLFEAQKAYGEPGFYFANDVNHGTNPCQPAWAPVLTQSGISTLGGVREGQFIWGGDRWVRVAKKWSTGVKKVYAFRTTAGTFYGTENHKVFSKGERVEAKDAESVDISTAEASHPLLRFAPDVMDGIVLGDGSVHKASNDLVYLCVGEKDDYADREVAHLLVERREGLGRTAWEVSTSITADELPLTYLRTIPDRFFYGQPSVVASFLRGLYSANGSICGDRVALKATSFAVIERAQIMLSSLGIASYWTVNKPARVKFANGEYECRTSYDLNITRHRGLFKDLIGFVQAYKTQALEELCARVGPALKPAKDSYDVREVELISEEEVFDITVDSDEHAYWTGGCKVSNCAEIGLYPYDQHGNSGVQFCNLSTIAARDIDSPREFFRRAFLASLIGTLQAGYSSFSFLGEVSENITRREALLGVSICGILDNPSILLRREVLMHGAATVRKANADVAKLLGINAATRTTCIKPEGTASIVLDSASGIHPRHAEKYLRRVRASKADPATAAFAAANPELVEDSYEDPTNTSVLTFACQAPAGAKLRENVSALELLEAAKIVQENWVQPGRSPDTVTDIHHNVSITVTVKPDEWDSVREHLWANRETYTGVALLQDFGDTAYPQAPLQTVRTPEELVVWEKALQAKVPDDWRHAATHDTGEEHRGTAVACSGGSCELKV